MWVRGRDSLGHRRGRGQSRGLVSGFNFGGNIWF